MFDVLRRHDAALCIHDLLESHPFELTADWAYVRFHGPDALQHPYQGSYGEARLRDWADRLGPLLDQGCDVYAHFNNDWHGHAVTDALTDREQLATVILVAYRGTVDDEGEDHEAALTAVDDWLSRLESPHSVVLEQDGQIVAASFVVNVGGREYIDPVAVVSARKREGLGRAAVATSLGSLHESGACEVGAVITDGNTPSERLFASLGFVRVASWE